MKLDRRGVSQQREYPTCQYIVHFLMVNFIFLNFTFKKKYTLNTYYVPLP